jgi:hypothetical protein
VVRHFEHALQIAPFRALTPLRSRALTKAAPARTVIRRRDLDTEVLAPTPDQNPTPGPHVTRGEREFEEMERIALYLLTDPENQPTIWSIPDIGRAMAYYDPRDALVEPLHRAGLVRRIGKEFVFATERVLLRLAGRPSRLSRCTSATSQGWT